MQAATNSEIYRYGWAEASSNTIEVTFDNNLQKDAFLERLTKARQYLSTRGLSADNNTVL